MPRLLHAAAATTLAGIFVPFPELVKVLLGAGALDVFARLDAFPDAREALDVLGERGIRAAVLTNGSEENTRTLLERNGLEVEQVVAVAEAQAYKPHPAPYRHACARLGLAGERVTLVAAHAWDVLGARQAGLQGVWVNREGGPWPFPASAEPVAADGLAGAARAVGTAA
jgi:2-haloacid dehalogenase